MTAATAAQEEQQLVAAFERIHRERMHDLPFLNAAMIVEAVGFRDWLGLRVGALITPWSLNLIILPGSSAQFLSLGITQTQRWSFPSGDYDFQGHVADGTGRYQQCSLFSPVTEFGTQDDARQAAQAALQELFTVPQQAVTDVAEKPRAKAPMSRRELLLGAAKSAS